MPDENKTEMTIEHYRHLDEIQSSAQVDIHKKYIKGVEDHGGQLWDKGIQTLIAKEIRAEAIDQVVYTECLLKGLGKIQYIAEKLAEETSTPYVCEAANAILLILKGKVQE